MNPRRYERLLASQTAVAKKVFMAVPIQEAWTPKRIYAELRRLDSTARDMRVVEGCVRSLADAGLVHEAPLGYFRRADVNDHDKKESTKSGKEAPAQNAIEQAFIKANIVGSEKKPAKPILTMNKAKKTSAEPVEETKPLHPLLDHPLYGAYLIKSVDRVVELMQLLSDQLDEEMGLALLEISDELSGLNGRQIEYLLHLGMKPSNVEEIFEAFPELESGKTLPYQALIKKLREPEPMLVVKEAPAKPVVIPEQETKPMMTNIAGVQIPTKTVPEEPGVSKRPSCIPWLTEGERKGASDLRIRGISNADEYLIWSRLVAPSRLRKLEISGLGVEERWLRSFKAFLSDVGYQPLPGAKFLRINPSVGFFKENVGWWKDGKLYPGRLTPPPGWPMKGVQENEVTPEVDLVKQAAEAEEAARKKEAIEQAQKEMDDLEQLLKAAREKLSRM